MWSLVHPVSRVDYLRVSTTCLICMVLLGLLRNISGPLSCLGLCTSSRHMYLADFWWVSFFVLLVFLVFGVFQVLGYEVCVVILCLRVSWRFSTVVIHWCCSGFGLSGLRFTVGSCTWSRVACLSHFARSRLPEGVPGGVAFRGA